MNKRVGAIVLAACFCALSGGVPLGVAPSARGAPDDHAVWKVAVSRKLVALTFDDGPDPRWTPSILSILERDHVPATFFVLGGSVVSHPDLVRREVRDGNEVECHGWNHASELYWPVSVTVSTFDRCASEVAGVGGVRPRIVRPPYGILRLAQYEGLEDAGFLPVQWSMGGIRRGRSTARTVALDARAARPGTVVLLHDGRADRRDVIRLLPGLIRALTKRGYSFVTLDQLLRDGTPVREPDWVLTDRFVNLVRYVPQAVLAGPYVVLRPSRPLHRPAYTGHPEPRRTRRRTL